MACEVVLVAMDADAQLHKNSRGPSHLVSMSPRVSSLEPHALVKQSGAIAHSVQLRKLEPPARVRQARRDGRAQCYRRRESRSAEARRVLYIVGLVARRTPGSSPECGAMCNGKPRRRRRAERKGTPSLLPRTHCIAMSAFRRRIWLLKISSRALPLALAAPAS